MNYLKQTLSSKHLENFLQFERSEIYGKYANFAVESQIKHFLNFSLGYSEARHILSSAYSNFFAEELDASASSWYMTASQLNELEEAGFYIGNHGHRHQNFSRLTFADAIVDLSESQNFLTKILSRSIGIMSNPYGAMLEDDLQKSLLATCNLEIGFSTIPAEIQPPGKRKPYALPRFDCNLIYNSV